MVAKVKKTGKTRTVNNRIKSKKKKTQKPEGTGGTQSKTPQSKNTKTETKKNQGFYYENIQPYIDYLRNRDPQKYVERVRSLREKTGEQLIHPWLQSSIFNIPSVEEAKKLTSEDRKARNWSHALMLFQKFSTMVEPLKEGRLFDSLRNLAMSEITDRVVRYGMQRFLPPGIDGAASLVFENLGYSTIYGILDNTIGKVFNPKPA